MATRETRFLRPRKGLVVRDDGKPIEDHHRGHGIFRRATARLRAKAFVDRRALFSSFARARSWVSRSIKECGPSDGELHYFELDKILLDKEHGFVLSAVIDGDDRRRGTTAPVDPEAPWGGRAPGTCKYRAGDLVAYAFDETRRRAGRVIGPEFSRARRG